MTKKRFSLVARVNTDDPQTIRPLLERLVGRGTVTKVGKKEFLIETEWEGEDEKELNHLFLSELRRVVKKTRLRAEWTSAGTTKRFFDYVLKKSIRKP